MSEFGPGPEETDAENWKEPTTDQEGEPRPQVESETNPEAGEVLIVETEAMIELRNQAIAERGDAPFLETGHFREQYLDPYLILANEQIPPDLAGEQKAQAELEIATLKGLFYHDVGLHTNVEGMIKVQRFAFDRLGRPELVGELTERIAQGRAERIQQLPEKEPLDPGVMEDFLTNTSILPTEGGDEIIHCDFQTEDNELFQRLVREVLLPRLGGSSAALIHGETLSPTQQTILAEEMLRTDFPVIAVYDPSASRYRVRYSEGDEAIGSFYQPRI